MPQSPVKSSFGPVVDDQYFPIVSRDTLLVLQRLKAATEIYWVIVGGHHNAVLNIIVHCENLIIHRQDQSRMSDSCGLTMPMATVQQLLDTYW